MFHHVFHVLYLAAGCKAFVSLAHVEEGWRVATGPCALALRQKPQSANVAIDHRAVELLIEPYG